MCVGYDERTLCPEDFMSSDIVPWIMYKGRFDADDWFDGLMTSISPYYAVKSKALILELLF